jgi:hypothetical protein
MAIQGIPLWELWLPVWDNAIAEGRLLQPLNRPPVDRAELVRYLRIVDEFARRHEYNTATTLTLRRLAEGTIVWRWNAHANGELLILSNSFGVSFPPPEEASTEPADHHSARPGWGLEDRIKGGIPAEVRDGADGRQPMSSSTTKAVEAPRPPKYACKPRPFLSAISHLWNLRSPIIYQTITIQRNQDMTRTCLGRTKKMTSRMSWIDIVHFGNKFHV